MADTCNWFFNCQWKLSQTLFLCHINAGQYNPRPSSETDNALPPPATNYTITGLLPYTEYEFQVLSQNDVNKAASIWVTARTLQTGEWVSVTYMCPTCDLHVAYMWPTCGLHVALIWLGRIMRHLYIAIQDWSFFLSIKKSQSFLFFTSSVESTLTHGTGKLGIIYRLRQSELTTLSIYPN